MYKSYFKIGWRNLLKNKGYSFINIGGLSIGMTVAMLIGLWVYDEVSFDHYHQNYDRVARVIVNHNFNGEISTQRAQPIPLGEHLKRHYSEDLEYVSMASWSYGHQLEHDKTKISQEGMFVEASFPEIVTLKMLSGNRNALASPHEILLSQSLAVALFGDEDPLGKTIKLDNKNNVTVSGIYEDLPRNSSFHAVKFVAPWLLFEREEWFKSTSQNWGNYSFQAFVQLKPAASMEGVSAKIKDVLVKNNNHADSKPELLLHAMRDWHLFEDFENGKNVGGSITFVWLFGTIGVFILLLACINFINLSTARSDKNAREVGVRKAIGSLQSQLAIRFLTESFMVVLIAFGLSLLSVQLLLDWFNQLAGKNTELVFNYQFVSVCIAFILLTGLLAGLYPAAYIASLKTIQVLRGTFHAGRSASIPRKTLIVLQFTVSVTLGIATIVVYQQLVFAKDRPIGYDRSSLVTTWSYSFGDIANKPVRYDYLRNELFKTGAVTDVAKSSSPTTDVYSNQSDFDWPGRDPGVMPNFAVIWCSHDYGKTIGMQFNQGRDFAREFTTDTAAMVLNETAARFMGMIDAVGKTVSFNRVPFTVIGVVNDLLMESPYASARPTVYMVDYNRSNIVTMKLNPSLGPQDCLQKIEPVFKAINPEGLFQSQFVDEAFDRKFVNEERIGQLSAAFSTISIFISCIGLFGVASFVAEQRTKEIGIRKVLGASVGALWRMLSKDFFILIIISCLIAIPLAYYFLSQWLQKYQYHIELSWWIFVVAAGAAITITLITVSLQAVKAALMNPVKSLRTE